MATGQARGSVRGIRCRGVLACWPAPDRCKGIGQGVQLTVQRLCKQCAAAVGVALIVS